MDPMNRCPECGGTEHRHEPGEYALIGLTNGQIQLHLDKPVNTAVVVTVDVCANCGRVSLHNAG